MKLQMKNGEIRQVYSKNVYGSYQLCYLKPLI
jgi:hypothetical protein